MVIYDLFQLRIQTNRTPFVSPYLLAAFGPPHFRLDFFLCLIRHSFNSFPISYPWGHNAWVDALLGPQRRLKHC